jgi:alkanesulfonate monooxygenase SsuD/methylene tetrahydromethanopterin reductase-like flavin-dependent oxidoreductase (luciferase family)
MAPHRLARGLHLGPPALAGPGPAGGRPVDHAGRDRHHHRTPAPRPMVTPLARRRPAKVARETATLDRLSGGRLTLGVGLGSDRFGSELSKTGEQLDDWLRGQMLDEALEILTVAWSGAPVHHRGRHYTVEGIQFLPRPVQQPGCRCGSPDSPAT